MGQLIGVVATYDFVNLPCASVRSLAPHSYSQSCTRGNRKQAHTRLTERAQALGYYSAAMTL